MSTSHLNTFLRGSAVSMAGVGLLGVINYLTRRYLALSLTPADYGTFYSMIALVGMVSGFSDLGITQAGTVLIAENAAATVRRDNCFYLVGGLKLTIGLFCFLAIWGFSGPIQVHYLHTTCGSALLLLAAMMVFQIAGGALSALWNGLKMFAALQFFQLVAAALILGAVVVLVPHGRLTGAALAFAVGPAVMVLAAGSFAGAKRIVGPPVIPFAPGVLSRLFRLCGHVAVATTMLTMMYYLDTVMLTALKGVESSALYNIALPIMQIVQALMVFPAVFLPIAVEMGQAAEYGRLRRFGRIACGLTVLILPLVFLVFHFGSALLIGLLFSEKYVAAAPAVTILCCGLVFYTLGNFLFQILLSVGEARLMAWIAAMTAVCNVLLNFFLIGLLDFVGAALATMLSYLVFALLCVIFLERKLAWLIGAEREGEGVKR